MQAASTCGSACRARTLISRSSLMGRANHTPIRSVKGKRVKDSKRIQKATRKRPSSRFGLVFARRSEEHTSELQSLMRISYAVFCLKKQNKKNQHDTYNSNNT